MLLTELYRMECMNSCKIKLDSEGSIAYIMGNNTCHASHLNSAPGQVFAFYGVFSFNLRSRKAHVIQ